MSVVEFHPHIGEKILVALRRAHMTQQELADQLGVNPSTVSRWIRGTVSPDFKTVVEIARLTRQRDLLNRSDLYDPFDVGKASSGWMNVTAGQTPRAA